MPGRAFTAASKPVILRMISDYNVRLALPGDAVDIAEMSRDFIEHGLGWGWTEARVIKNIRDRSTNVAVIREEDQLFGFGIMKYREETAHLFLLGVHFLRRRRGIGSALLAWLEASAQTAGLEKIGVEARADNQAARLFYRDRGYREVGAILGYYRGAEDAVRLEKVLRGQ
jgi:[ribosomal protein S18]-alanine N-acetyltransferase